jgi:hypothetical protein
VAVRLDQERRPCALLGQGDRLIGQIEVGRIRRRRVAGGGDGMRAVVDCILSRHRADQTDPKRVDATRCSAVDVVFCTHPSVRHCRSGPVASHRQSGSDTVLIDQVTVVGATLHKGRNHLLDQPVRTDNVRGHLPVERFYIVRPFVDPELRIKASRTTQLSNSGIDPLTGTASVRPASSNSGPRISTLARVG